MSFRIHCIPFGYFGVAASKHSPYQLIFLYNTSLPVNFLYNTQASCCPVIVDLTPLQLPMSCHGAVSVVTKLGISLDGYQQLFHYLLCYRNFKEYFVLV